MTSWRDRIKPQPMFDVLSMARERELKGHYVARMEIGDTPGFQNDHIHGLISKYSSSPYRYSPSRGEGALIRKVVETQWPGCSEENIVIGPANFLITAALASVTSPGDLVLLPDPGFASYKLSADFLGLDIVYYSVYQSGNPEFPNLAEILSNLPKRPKAIMINNPSNPLGIAFEGSQVFDQIREFPNLGIEVIIDETYINLVYDNTDSKVDSLSAIRLRSFSKEHCAPGLRIGYALASQECATTMANLMSLSISCVPQFIQFAVTDYLGSKESFDFTESLKQEMSRRLQYVANAIPDGMLQSRPNAAFYSLIDMGVPGGDKGFKFLLERNVSTCPGSKFGKNSENSVRISLAGSKELFEQDVEMLSVALNEWRSQLS
jgi:aspartate/methionine/tyrosine aminotransferase